MTVELSDLVIALFLIFCRIGTCLLLMPGFSSTAIPMQIRLFVAVAISLALSPALLPDLQPLVVAADDNGRLALMMTEILNGLFIGLLGRSFMIALQFAGHIIANSIGMGQAMGVAIEDRDPMPAVASLVTLTATTLIFVLNLHAEVARALVASYTALPVAEGFSVRGMLSNIADNLDEALPAMPSHLKPFRAVRRHREFRHRPRQQADPDDPGLLHLSALRAGRRPRPLRLHDRRFPSAVHAGFPTLGTERMSENGERLRRMGRLLKVQAQKRLLEEWRLSHLKEARARIDRDDVDLLESLGTASALHGLFIESKVKTLRRNDLERRENLKDQTIVEGRIVAARRSEKGIERLRDEARLGDEAAEVAQSLEASLDGFLSRGRTSLE